MENNKYYTPQIEEFCVGFEYEEYQQKEWNKLISPPKSLGYEWVTKTFNTSTSLSKIKSKITGANGMNWMLDGVDQEHPSCKIRIKKLNEQDILESGFSFFGENNKTLINTPVKIYHNDELNLMLGHYYEANQIVIATKDPSKSEIFCKTGQDPSRTGFLSIKNKNELQKLLKQLEIC